MFAFECFGGVSGKGYTLILEENLTAYHFLLLVLISLINGWVGPPKSEQCLDLEERYGKMDGPLACSYSSFSSGQSKF